MPGGECSQKPISRFSEQFAGFRAGRNRLDQVDIPRKCRGYVEAMWRLRGGYAEVSEYHPTIISQGPGRSMQVST